MDNDARAQMVRLFEAATQAGLIPAESQPSTQGRHQGFADSANPATFRICPVALSLRRVAFSSERPA
jgi:hypothetical protein